MTLPYESHDLKRKFIEVFHSCFGNITLSCKNAGIDRSTYYDSVKIPNVTQKAIDFVENKLIGNINGGDTTAAIFFLKTQGKKRGYSEKVELEHAGKDGGTIKHEFDISKYSKEAIDALIRIKEEG